jgi:transcriptional regulator with XRE-family HTH domain
MSQGELAKALGLTEAMVSRYIHGISVPSVYKVCQMANVIGCDISDLIKSEYKL